MRAIPSHNSVISREQLSVDGALTALAVGVVEAVVEF